MVATDADGEQSTLNINIVIAGKPSPPATVRATPGERAIAVRWSAPSGEIAPITGYRVRWKTADAAAFGAPVTAAADARNHEIPGLQNGVEYAVAVSAVNIAGESEAQAAELSADLLPGRRLTPLTPPPPPQNVSIAVASGATRVTWQPPRGGGTITTYRIRWRPAEPPNSAWANSGGAAGNQVVARAFNIGDTAGMAHQVQIAAVAADSNRGIWSRTPFYRYTLRRAIRTYKISTPVNDPQHGYYAGGDEITYTFTRIFPQRTTGLPPGLTFDATANAIVGTPSETTTGIHFFRHAAATGTANAGDNIQLIVIGGVTFGAAKIANQTYHQYMPIHTLTLPAASGAGNLQYKLLPALPPGLTFDATARTVSGTPTAPALFRFFTYTASGDDGSSAELHFGILVRSALPFPRRAPDVPYQVNVGEAVSLPLPSVSAGVAPFAYRIIGELPAGLRVDIALRRIHGMPEAVTPKRKLTWSVSDSNGSIGSWPFEIEVADDIYFTARAADREYEIGESVMLTLPAVMGGSGQLLLTLSGLPDGLIFTKSSRNISGSPERIGRREITYTALDRMRGDAISQIFHINIVSVDSEELQSVQMPEDGIGGKIRLAPFAVAQPDEETRFELVDAGGAADARLGADYTLTSSSFTLSANLGQGFPDVKPEIITFTTRERTDRYIEARTRRVVVRAVPVAGDTGKYKSTDFELRLADIDADTATLRMTLVDAGDGEALETLFVDTPRRVKIRAALVYVVARPGLDDSGQPLGDLVQPLSASQEINFSFTYPSGLGAPSDAPAQLRILARRPYGESSAFVLRPPAAGIFTFSGSTFTPDFGALQSAQREDVREPQITVSAIPLTRAFTLGGDLVISEAGDVSQQSVEIALTAGARAAVSAMITADEAPGANSASPADFRPGGEVASAFPVAFAASEHDGTTAFHVVIPLRANDQLVEGRESFMLSLSARAAAPARARITIAEDGQARLSVSAPQTADGAEVIFRGELALQRTGDRGIAVGAGGSLTYANDNTPPQTLVFADADRDGILAGDELRAASAGWAVEPAARERTFTLQNAGALPAGLRAAQFLPAAGVVVRVAAPPVVALNQDSIALAESADFAATALRVTITPPLSAPGKLLLEYTPGSAGADDYLAATAPLTLPAGAASVALPGSMKNDQTIESQEQYTITISAPPGAGYVVDPAKNRVTVTIEDNDIARVIFLSGDLSRPNRALLVNAGAAIALAARITGIVQVGATAELRIADSANNAQMRFTDADGDGLLNGDELDARFIWLSPLGNFAATTFAFAPAQDAPRGLTAAGFDIAKLVVQKRPGSGMLQTPGAGEFREETASGAYTLPLALSTDVRQAFGVEVIMSFDADGPFGPAPPKTLRKSAAFTADEDARDAKSAEFTAADFVTLGLADDLLLNGAREVMFTAQLDAATLARGAMQMRAEHALVIEDDERAALVRYRLVDADGAPIARFRTGSPSIAFLSAEIFNPARAAANGNPARPETPVTLGIPALALTPRLPDAGMTAAGLSAGELGGIILPVLRIPFGQSRVISDERLLITPARNGRIQFTTAAILPQLLRIGNVAMDAPHFASNDAPDVSAQAARARNIVADELSGDAALLDEGGAGITLGFRIETLQGVATPLQKNGADVEAQLHYTVAAGEVAAFSAEDDDLADLPGKTTSFGAATVTIPAGANSGVIPIPDIIDDAMEEQGETFVITLSGLTDADGGEIAGAAIPSAGAVARYVIVRSDIPAGKLLGMEVSGTPSEAGGAAVITLTRPPGSSAAISGLLLPGEASADVADYGESRMFTIPAGMPSVQVMWPLVDDEIIEGNEEFIIDVLITAPADNSVTAPARALRVPIADDDTGTLALAETRLVAPAGAAFSVRVTLSAAAKRDVHFTVTPVFDSGAGKASAADLLASPRDNRRIPASSAAELTVSNSIAAGALAAEFLYLTTNDADLGVETFDLALSFTDSMDGSAHDGNITLGASTAAVILNPRLTITPEAASKVYGDADPAPAYAANFAQGDDKAAVFSETPIMRDAGEDAGGYAYRLKNPLPFNPGFAGKYAAVLDAANSFAITPKKVTYTSAAADKIYDGNAGAPPGLGGSFAAGDLVNASVNGVAIDDTLRLRAGGGMYADKTAAEDKMITGFALAGDAAGNYELDAASSVSGDITQFATTYTATAAARAYDAGVTAPLPLMGGTFDPPLPDGDSVTINTATATYADAAAATGKMLAGLAAAGDDAGNYAVTFAVSGEITRRALRVTADNTVAVPASGRPAAGDLTLSVAAGAAGEGYAPGEGFAEAFRGALAYGTANADGSIPILRGDLAAAANYEIAAFTAGLLTIGIAFDADGSEVADATDGVLIARYLLGLRGEALLAGLKDDLHAGATAETIKTKIAAAKGNLDVDGVGGANAADGIMIARYLLGVTGAALTAGQSSMNPEEVAKTIADTLPVP
ncbi:MAG: putative Ig domain-containing protein [Gammaproteobacteria bacterium]